MKNPPLHTTHEPRPHAVAPQLKGRTITVALVGCGGNGGQMLSGLARLDVALRACGHPDGLHVVAFDPDTVSEANIGRQLFYPCDVGANKAQVLVHRLNLGLGLTWQAVSDVFRSNCIRHTHTDVRGRLWDNAPPSYFDIVITCVDTVRSRRDVHHTLRSQRGTLYWLDLGNRARDGQVILGQPYGASVGNHAYANLPPLEQGWSARDALAAEQDRLDAERLPTVIDLNPEMLDEDFEEEDAPSCSLLEALTRQDLFINQHVATWGLELLWKLLRRGTIEHHAAYINLESGRVVPRLVPSMQPGVPLGARLGARPALLQVLDGGAGEAPAARNRPRRARRAA